MRTFCIWSMVFFFLKPTQDHEYDQSILLSAFTSEGLPQFLNTVLRRSRIETGMRGPARMAHTFIKDRFKRLNSLESLEPWLNAKAAIARVKGPFPLGCSSLFVQGWS